MPAQRPRAVATRSLCVLAVPLALFLARGGGQPLPPELLAVFLLPALGLYLDWIRLHRPSGDDAFFGAAVLGGALVVGAAPSAVTALWHPALFAVALGVLARRRIVEGHIAEVSGGWLLLDVGAGRLEVDREAHPELGDDSALELREGQALALETQLHRRSRGTGPYRSASVLEHGTILAAARDSKELRAARRSQLRWAVGLVLLSATLGWGAALMNLTIGSPCPV